MSVEGLRPLFTNIVLVPWYYPRGTGDTDMVDDMGMPRFLNSGCLIGRAGQVSLQDGEGFAVCW